MGPTGEVYHTGVRALLFDFSGVIRSGSRRKAIFDAVAEEYGVSKKVLKAELSRQGYGRLKAKDLAAAIPQTLCALDAASIPEDQADATLAMKLVDENVRLIRSLKPHFKMAIVANSDGTLERRLRRHGLRDLFNVVIDSAVVGSRKPGPEIYLLAAAHLECAPEECLFVDDKIENVIGATNVGMRALRYSAKEGDSLERVLSEHGVRLSSD